VAAVIEGVLMDWISQLSAHRYDTSMNLREYRSDR